VIEDQRPTPVLALAFPGGQRIARRISSTSRRRGTQSAQRSQRKPVGFDGLPGEESAKRHVL